MMKNKEVFLEDLCSFIQKEESLSRRDQLTCANCFENIDNYSKEKSLISIVKSNDFSNTSQKGDALENLMKSLFNKVSLIASTEKTNKPTAIGQIDLLLTPLRSNLYDIWGLASEKPKGIIGECKNYSKAKDQNKISKQEIEKSCWRACKSGCLSFFVGPEYTEDARLEVAYYNNHKHLLCTNHTGALLVPISLPMIEIVIESNINFCYFIYWAIMKSQGVAPILNYL
jgi:hypothetical protein